MDTPKKFSRKDFLNLVWGAAGVLTLGELSWVGLRFLSPRAVDGQFGGRFTLGAPDDYLPGSVTPIEAGNFYLVRLEDGGFIALSRRCTHLGCAVPYEPVEGQFVCPCHGSAFTLDGEVVNPPAPRSLDLYTLTIEEGQVIVDTSHKIEREHASPSDAVYPA